MDFRRVEPVSGPRAYTASVIGRWLLGICLVLTLAVGVTATFARPSDPGRSYFVAYFWVLGSWLASALAIAVVGGVVQVQMRRERSRGFTWSQDQYRNLDQIDPVTNVIIREAGQDYLTRAQRIERVAQARAWAAEHEVTR